MRKRVTVWALACGLVAAALYLAVGRLTGPTTLVKPRPSIETVDDQLPGSAAPKNVSGWTTAGGQEGAIAAARNSRDAVNQADDLFELMQSLAKMAYDGDDEAQLTIARAQIVCDLSLPFAANVPRRDSPGLQKLKHDAARCAAMKEKDPFAALPARSGGYTSMYWLTKAAEDGHSLAGAILSANTVHIALGEPPSEERQAKLRQIESRLETAVRASTREHYYYIAQTLLQADAQTGANAIPRGAAWYLMACRAGGCADAPEPVDWECPPGLGNSCDLSVAAAYHFDAHLGPARYARAVQLSYEIEDLIRKQKWNELDLTINANQ